MSNASESKSNSTQESESATTARTTVKPADLRALMQEQVDAPVRIQHPSEPEWDEIDTKRLSAAQSLADRLYHLTNIERETDLSIYLETINSIVLDTESEENQVILQITRDYFIEAYGNDIRRLGHSPLLEDQIVHRTGRDSREIVEKTLMGFDVRHLAASVRERAIRFSEDAPKVAARVMYDLTHRQVSELRSFYATLPAKEIAALLHKSLKRRDLRGKPYPDADTITYILLFRSAKEIAQIECQYNETYHFDRSSGHELCFREQIQDVFSEQLAAELLALLDGFQANHFADLIYDRIQHYISIAESLENTSDLHNDFAGLFRRKHPDTPIWKKELMARCPIEQIIAHLSTEQFREVCDSLEQRYDLSITEELYPSIRQFNARSTALNLYKSCLNVEPRSKFRRAEQYLSDRELLDVKDEYRLSKNHELSDIIQARAEEKKASEALARSVMALAPISYLTPQQLQQTRIAFQSVIGTPMDTFVCETVSHISHGEIPRYVNDFVELILSGTGRQGLHADIFHLFANKAKRSQDKQRQEKKNSLFAKLPTLTAAVERAQADESATDLIRLLESQSTSDLHLLEELFIEASEAKIPFLKALETILNSDSMSHIKMLFEGIHCSKLVKEIHDSPLITTKLLRMDPEYVALICNQFKATFDIDLYDYIRSRFSARDDATQNQRAKILLFCLAPEVKKIRSAILRCSDNSFQDRDLLPILLHYKDDAQTLEACYNLYYYDFTFIYEKDPSSLLRSLRVLASKGTISREVISKAILILEHVPSHITGELHDLLKDRALTSQTLQNVHDLLRMHFKDVATIKRSYNALDPDFTIRETLYQLQLTLDDINKTILIVDGYDPDTAARRIHDLIQQLDGEELGKTLSKLLAQKTTAAKQGFIPSDANWTSEMYHQIRCCYEHIFGNSLLLDLVSKKVPLKGSGINAIAYMLYGSVSTIAVDIFTALQQGPNSSASILEKLLRKEKARLRARIIAMYDAYFVSLGRSKNLRDCLHEAFGNSETGTILAELLDEAERVLSKKENISTADHSKTSEDEKTSVG